MIEKLKYAKKWLEYGFINESELAIQIEEFEKGEDLNTEHYRYKSFLNILQKKLIFTDEEIDNFIELVELDDDQGMAGTALCKMYLCSKLTNLQLTKVEIAFIKFGSWAEKIINRRIEKLK